MPDRDPLKDEASFPISSACFWTPIRPGTASGWVEHAPFAFWLTETMRPRCFVELGSHTGYSYSAVCQTVQNLKLSTRCYAVDSWLGDDHAGFYGENIFADLKSFNDLHYNAFSRMIRSTFSEAVHHFADGSIDLLHIDGRHAYEDVKADYLEWEPKLSADAIVLFHDTNVRERDFGVAKFWKEISADRPHFEFLHGNGLGVLGPSGTAPTRLSSLFDCAHDADTMASVRALYGRLGSALTDHYLLSSLRPEFKESQALVVDLQRDVADLTREKAAFSDGCEERNTRIMDMQARIVDLEREKGAYVGGCLERDGIIIEHQAKIADLERHLTELRTSMAPAG